MCRVDQEITCSKCSGIMYLDDWTSPITTYWVCMGCGHTKLDSVFCPVEMETSFDQKYHN